MHRVLHRLPSLDFLRGFEAAGRRLSFTLAAEELFLTQSALSRQVKALEEALGVSLFERRHRALALTAAGAAFHRSVSLQLREIAAAAESGGRLLVASTAPARDLFTPLLLRSVANALGPVPDLPRAEIVPIADRWLREWSRPPGPAAAPDADALRRDDTDNDRRWLWLAALALLAVETWMRRSRTAPDERREDIARVA